MKITSDTPNAITKDTLCTVNLTTEQIGITIAILETTRKHLDRSANANLPGVKEMLLTVQAVKLNLKEAKVLENIKVIKEETLSGARLTPETVRNTIH